VRGHNHQKAAPISTTAATTSNATFDARLAAGRKIAVIGTRALDHDRGARHARIKTQRRIDRELHTRPQAEVGLIFDGAGGPSFICDPRHQRHPHVISHNTLSSVGTLSTRTMAATARAISSELSMSN
jgi:hypothetical protein